MDLRSPFGYCNVDTSVIAPSVIVIWTCTGPHLVCEVSPWKVPESPELCDWVGVGVGSTATFDFFEVASLLGLDAGVALLLGLDAGVAWLVTFVAD